MEKTTQTKQAMLPEANPKLLTFSSFKISLKTCHTTKLAINCCTSIFDELGIRKPSRKRRVKQWNN